MSDAAFSDGYWESADGLKLHYRDYPGRGDRPPILCIPGLTRNARDFEELAGALSGEWRVICAELRGRGESDYAKDSSTYNPLQYAADIAALAEQAGIEKFVAFGTSLGGIVTMLLGATRPGLIAGALINDIGPAIEPEGMARIREYVGQGRSFPTWMHAARALKETNGLAYPAYGISDWLAMAKRVLVVSGSGRIVFDYDMKIAEPIHTAPPDAPAGDLWPAWRALAGRPLLVLRGALSDLLSAATLERMKQEIPEAETVTIDGVGHPPTLSEPTARDALARLLARCA
jgi:pimeloyl-ACP methyl ester carboxylesterase